MKTIKTLDDIKDLSIIIVNEMIENGLIKDCTNTDDSDGKRMLMVCLEII